MWKMLIKLLAKAVVNIRTDRLAEYVQAVKQRNKKRDKADRLRLKMPHHTPEVQVAIQEEEKVEYYCEKLIYTRPCIYFWNY
jgi:hypothetical protein